MIFTKKKRMIDLRELQKRGVVKIPRNDLIIPTNADGFVELTGNKTVLKAQNPTTNEDTNSNKDFFNFLESNPGEEAVETYMPENQSNFQSQVDGYNKREVDEKIINLDNKLYKLEQRIELLERKLDVGSSPESQTGIIGW